MDEGDADGNHDPAHDQGADDAPKEQPMLKFPRYLKPAEDERDDQDVIKRERKLDDVAGGELDCRFASAPMRHGAGEQHGQGEPEHRPSEGFLEFDCMRPAMEQPQVER